MSNLATLVISPLSSDHDRLGFDCGDAPLNNYIQKLARQDVKRRISRVFVATTTQEPKNILGYYTLSSLSIELSHLPSKLADKLPKHPVPAALIGRLAVHKRWQQKGIGKMLLVDAIKRTLSISEEIAIYAMVVDAIDENAKTFYEQFGFNQLNSWDMRLFLPLKSI